MMGGKMNSKFLRYSWLERAHGAESNVADNTTTSLFPCFLPYPEVFYSSGVGGKPVNGGIWAKRYLNAFIAWCNYVELGCPNLVGGVCEPRVAYQSEVISRGYADRLLGEVEKFGSDELIGGMLEFQSGRRAVEEALLKVQCAGPGYLFSETGLELGGALEVKTDRIAVPEKAGTVDPLDHLTGDRAAVFSNMECLRRPEEAWDPVVPACHRVSPADESGLMRRLLESGMVVLVEESKLPQDSKGSFLPGGLFCVSKNSEEDRLILDRRPQNATVDRVVWARLPSGACFTRMLLKPWEYLRGSGSDLRNYYFALKLPENWIRYNAVGRRVSEDVARDFGGQKGLQYRACFRVLGMGDRNACDIAQATHEAILEKVGLLESSTKLVYGDHAPTSNIWEGVYLDDLLVVQKCSMEQDVALDGTFSPPSPASNDEDQLRMSRAEKAYEQAGLKRATHKDFRGETSFRAWGAEVSGVEGHVGAPLKFRQETWSLICRVVKFGFCSKKILQKILGYVCFIFQYRRELYSLQHHIYKFVQGLPTSGWRPIPGFILDELRSIGLHLAFAFWDMRRPLSETLVSTDATPSSGGAARAVVSEALAEELWRCSEVRGENTRLDETDFSRMLDEWSCPKEPSTCASVVGKCLVWQPVSSYAFRSTSHINLQEGRAVKNEVKRMVLGGFNNIVQVALNDSRVICGALSKGRSSSFKLNGILRSMLPYLVVGRISLALLWVETESNPADHPSRFREIPPPLTPPRWLRRLVRGRKFVGWELFAGTGRLTRAHLKKGLEMLEPVELANGSDVMSPWIEERLRAGGIFWVWLAPPCGSFSPLRNLDRYGPLRPKGFPEGDEKVPEVRLGNLLWRRALWLAEFCRVRGIYFFIEHPRDSKAWLMKDTQKLLQKPGVHLYEIHWCMFEDEEREGLPNKKPTRVLTTAPWFKDVIKTCDGSHQHGPPLRGKRAKLAGAYPWGFCRALAEAFLQWQ